MRIGTSGWSYPPSSGPGSWTGVFYPPRKTDELKFYSRFFNTVEVNSTFYRPCTSKTAESWTKRTPDGFEFTVKVWQQFTHKKGLWTPEEAGEFKEGIRPLVDAGKLGTLLFQFPASFKHGAETMEELERLLVEFEDFPKVVELRHQSWNEVEELDAGRVFIDEPKFKDSIRQEFRPWGRILYVRFHGRQFDKWWRHEHRNERYDYLYERKELQPYAVRLKSILEDKDIQRAYVFFNNHPGAKAVANAMMMRAEMDVPVTSELPEQLIEAFPELASRDWLRPG